MEEAVRARNDNEEDDGDDIDSELYNDGCRVGTCVCHEEGLREAVREAPIFDLNPTKITICRDSRSALPTESYDYYPDGIDVSDKAIDLECAEVDVRVGISTCVIDAQGHTRLFIGIRAILSLRGITFVNGNAQNASDIDGGAILLAESTVFIGSSTFVGNMAQHGAGGAITVQDTDVTIRDNTLFRANAGRDGGAIALYDSDIIITDSNFEDNRSSSGGAIIFNRGTANVVNNIFIRNNATSIVSNQ
jgi:hypothetical protein